MTTKCRTKKDDLTLKDVNEFKRVMKTVAKWISAVPREEMTMLAVLADKEAVIFDALKTFIERVMECNEVILGRVARQIISTAAHRSRRPSENLIDDFRQFGLVKKATNNKKKSRAKK